MYNTKEYKILYFYFSFACLNFVFPSSTVLAKPQGNAADSCQDLREECAELAEDGGCEGNVEFMEVFCQQTCDTCRPRSKVSGCEDQREECGFWGVTGQCDFNPAYMNINCPVTCQACPPLTPEDCVDQHRFCFLGSLLGLCRTNPSFYLVFCGDSCRRFISVCRAGIQCGKKPNITSTVNENTASYLRQRRGVGVSHQPQENDSCSTLPLNSAGREAITLLLSDYDAAGMQDENELEHWIKSVLLVFLERVQMERPPSRPPMNQPFTPSEQQPTPQQPLSSIDVKVRALVPFCTASGYLSLVRRLRRLIRGNTGRPLNPIAASLAVSVNFCQYGVGKRGMSVPDPPRQLQQLSVAQSFPGLELFQGGQTPPPPVSPDVPTGTLLNDTQVEGEEPAGPRPVTEDNVNDRDAFSCGGALISPYHVVTAAHCLLEPGVKGNNTVNFLKYVARKLWVMFVVVVVVQFTEALQPYCLPRVGIDLVGRPLTMSGWGVRPGGQVATILHNITVRVVSEDECSDAYDDDDISVFFEVLYPEGVNKLLMCATSEEPVCRGDSGGPLVLDEEQIQYEVGVVSTGYGCGASHYPGIYTNISQFLTWIEEEVYDGCSMMSVAY
ncbi:Transmembrane protease serine 4 [Portunus trituberculatus]|uniref:Transmembrane protease serine 4 n=1 Tax=Portunus trituberculatus TaxID=210409 RepID=A0A5B7DW15_PORTR|nr:Transmembrane protease serine 4 [Portunus trituberculatus]